MRIRTPAARAEGMRGASNGIAVILALGIMGYGATASAQWGAGPNLPTGRDLFRVGVVLTAAPAVVASVGNSVGLVDHAPGYGMPIVGLISGIALGGLGVLAIVDNEDLFVADDTRWWGMGFVGVAALDITLAVVRLQRNRRYRPFCTRFPHALQCQGRPRSSLPAVLPALALTRIPGGHVIPTIGLRFAAR